MELFDTFYLCYDEPNRQQNWDQIQSVIPSAKKMEGVQGFDRALKSCAKEAKTDHFFVIDGDNQLIQSRLDNIVSLESVKDHWVLSWASRNSINGLIYGNGGLKLWPKTVAMDMKTHEHSKDSGDRTDYCFVVDYYLMNDWLTETIPNSTHQQAFRAGFREGVKMSLVQGVKVPLTKKNFFEHVTGLNRDRLRIWCERGADAINGYWGILGARMGLYFVLQDEFDETQINSYDWIDEVLDSTQTEVLKYNVEELASSDWNPSPLKALIHEYGDKILALSGLKLDLLSPVESLKSKRESVYQPRSGLLK